MRIRHLMMAFARRGNRQPFATVGNRVTRLEDLGLVRTASGRERSVELTEIGEGASAGMEAAGQLSEAATISC